MNKPKIDNAPGLTWRQTKIGWEARWQCRTDVAKRGYRPRTLRIWASEPGSLQPTDFEVGYIQMRCTQMQDEMLAFARGGIEVGAYDGTVESLIRCYQTDEDSVYRKNRYNTRSYYDSLCRVLIKDIGDRKIAELTARDLLRWNEKYVQAGKIPMGNSLVRMLRGLVTFGATLLADKDCRELKTMLHDMRFKGPKARVERLTADQIVAICAEAHKIGRPSVALAQALQFGLTLRQKDIIGEWVPISEERTPLTSITNGNAKWIRGLDWREINDNFILVHTTSKRQKDIVADLKLEPLIVQELGSLNRADFPASGPVVISEKGNLGLPYTTGEWRKVWRRCADAAGVPKTVKNMDTRAGAITEALNAGAEMDKVRKTATHSDMGMTMRYSRGDAEATAEVMKIRIASRNKPEPKG